MYVNVHISIQEQICGNCSVKQLFKRRTQEYDVVRIYLAKGILDPTYFILFGSNTGGGQIWKRRVDLIADELIADGHVRRPYRTVFVHRSLVIPYSRRHWRPW